MEEETIIKMFVEAVDKEKPMSTTTMMDEVPRIKLMP